MIKLDPIVVTPDDYKNFFGEDLAVVLRTSDNDSNYPNIFIRMVQDFLIDWCDTNGFRRTKKLSELNPIQYEKFQKAVLYQTYYTVRNGSMAIGLDSGVDGERGPIFSETDLKRIQVPDRVVMLLHNSGLFNLNIKNKPRVTRGYPWTGPMGDYY